jgi:hypothetical protein
LFFMEVQMLFPRRAIVAITAAAVVLVLLIAPNLLLRQHAGEYRTALVPAYCVDVIGPDGSGWGGATVCTPDGQQVAPTTQSAA